MSPDDFRRLAAAGLNTEQIALVMEMLASEAAAVSANYEALIEAGKEKSRERWRKWKSTKPNVSKRLQTTANVSQQLAPVEDKTLTSVIEPQEKKEGKVRACRLPTDFAPDVSWAVSQGLSPSQAETEAAKFRDYWSSKGANATKTDWPATWRNWVRSAVERQPQNRAPPPVKPPTAHEIARNLLRTMEQADEDPTSQTETDRALIVSFPGRQYG